MISKVAVPSAPAPETLELLVRARLLLAHAVSHAENPVGVDSLIAVHGIDNVVEFTLRILALHLDFEAVSGARFPPSELAEMAGTLDRFLLENYTLHLPYIAEIKTLRQVRNLVQHGAMDPGADLRRLVTLVERYFSRIVTMIFGLDSSELSISTIVREQTVCSFLREAEKALEQRSYLEAIVGCRDAFDNARFLQGRQSDLRHWATTASARIPTRDVITPLFFEALVNELEAARLGIHDARYLRFRNIMDDLPGKYLADPLEEKSPRTTFTLDEARYCYGFAAEYVLRWQSEHSSSSERILDNAPNARRGRYFVDDIEIPQDFERAQSYHAGDGLFFIACVPPEVHDLLSGFSIGSAYSLRFETWVGDELIGELRRDVTMVNWRFRLRTHRPPRWEVCFFLRQVPLTWHQRDYSNGAVVKESLCINTASEDELAALSDINIIGTRLARQIVTRRRKSGKIASIGDLRSIPGIKARQLQWLAEFTRL